MHDPIADYFTTYQPHAEPARVLSTLFATVRDALQRANCFPLTNKRIYDAGCGGGVWLDLFHQWGAQPHRLTGIDLTPSRIADARAKLPGATLTVGDASQSGLASGSQDLVTAFVVFSTILDPLIRQRLADEMMRVKKPDGVILVYDLRINNPRNPHIRRVSARERRALFHGRTVSTTSVTLAPPIARRVKGPLYDLLSRVPLLRSHALSVIR